MPKEVGEKKIKAVAHGEERAEGAGRVHIFITKLIEEEEEEGEEGRQRKKPALVPL